MHKLLVLGSSSNPDRDNLYEIITRYCWLLGGPENVEVVVGEEDEGLNSLAAKVARSKNMRCVVFDKNKLGYTDDLETAQLAKMCGYCRGDRTAVLIAGVEGNSSTQKILEFVKNIPDFTAHLVSI